MGMPGGGRVAMREPLMLYLNVFDFRLHGFREYWMRVAHCGHVYGSCNRMKVEEVHLDIGSCI
jgi:hypothetical protein